EPAIREAHSLQLAQVAPLDRFERALVEDELEVDDLLDLREEPWIDLRVAVQLVDAHADAERVGDVPEPLAARIRELIGNRVGIDGLEVEAVDADLQAAQRLLQRFLERAADSHDLADGLHLRR